MAVSPQQRYALVPPDKVGVHQDYYKIEIEAGDSIVSGQMKKEFSFTLGAEWQQLIGGSIPGVETLKKMGHTGLTTGVLSQKYYSGGGYISFPLEFRVFEDGTGLVSSNTKTLGHFMVANSGGETVGAAFKAGAEAALQYINPLKTGQALASAASKLWERVVTLRIGNFFSCSGMIITSFDCTWSRELTRSGPLYADFNITLESLQAIHRGTGIFGIQSIIGNGTSRVKIISKPEDKIVQTPQRQERRTQAEKNNLKKNKNNPPSNG